MSPAYYLVGALGLAVLMVVHESGHYFAAKRFGMRVTRFSIGFGPRLYKHQPEGSPTTFQIKDYSTDRGDEFLISLRESSVQLERGTLLR